MEAELFHADGRTDRLRDNEGFRNFANPPATVGEPQYLVPICTPPPPPPPEKRTAQGQGGFGQTPPAGGGGVHRANA